MRKVAQESCWEKLVRQAGAKSWGEKLVGRWVRHVAEKSWRKKWARKVGGKSWWKKLVRKAGEANQSERGWGKELWREGGCEKLVREVAEGSCGENLVKKSWCARWARKCEEKVFEHCLGSLRSRALGNCGLAGWCAEPLRSTCEHLRTGWGEKFLCGLGGGMPAKICARWGGNFLCRVGGKRLRKPAHSHG